MTQDAYVCVGLSEMYVDNCHDSKTKQSQLGVSSFAVAGTIATLWELLQAMSMPIGEVSGDGNLEHCVSWNLVLHQSAAVPEWACCSSDLAAFDRTSSVFAVFNCF